MELLYGQAGTENALKSSEQARHLAIFTWLTVFFVSNCEPQAELKTCPSAQVDFVESNLETVNCLWTDPNQTPVSFVMSLLALQIESFPSLWAQWQVLTGCSKLELSKLPQSPIVT